MTSPFPDGIEENRHQRPRLWSHTASPISFLVLAAIIALAMSGLLGGKPNTTLVSDTPAARLEVDTGTIMRNGIFFETRIHILPKQAIHDLVLGVTPSLWRDLTINSMIPAAGEEASRGGLFRFSYGPAEAGETIEIKIDGQINPPLFGGTAGEIVLLDGERVLARIPVSMKVRP